jgi:1-acyl-sn-glycerol-3-phosphate acyltransferase
MVGRAATACTTCAPGAAVTAPATAGRHIAPVTPIATKPASIAAPRLNKLVDMEFLPSWLVAQDPQRPRGRPAHRRKALVQRLTAPNTAMPGRTPIQAARRLKERQTGCTAHRKIAYDA